MRGFSVPDRNRTGLWTKNQKDVLPHRSSLLQTELRFDSLIVGPAWFNDSSFL